jgi:hypothetical protein
MSSSAEAVITEITRYEIEESEQMRTTSHKNIISEFYDGTLVVGHITFIFLGQQKIDLFLHNYDILGGISVFMACLFLVCWMCMYL